MPRASARAAADTRAAILERAVDDASRLGLEGLTIGNLAGDLGMTKSGLIGHFGNKERLQLAVLDEAVAIFLREVWKPAMREHPGRTRLLSLCDSWTSYLEREVFPGGCLMTTASVEFDNRDGVVRDAVAATMGQWLAMLEREARVAVEAGELSAGTDPADVAYELNALAVGANCDYQLRRDRQTLERARRAMRRVLAPAH